MQQSKCSIMIERDCTTLVNPISGDAKAYLLDRCCVYSVSLAHFVM